MNVPYKTFPKTYSKKSLIKGAGIGLFTKKKLEKFEWIGFYPGVLDKIENVNGNAAYIMGTRKLGVVISANEKEMKGVHLVNEGNNMYKPNVWYVKFKNGLCLYFAGREIAKNEELLTCYSRSYGIRSYEITFSEKCTDPRCIKMNKCQGTHRNKSLFYRGWKKKLKDKMPKKKELKNKLPKEIISLIF